MKKIVSLSTCLVLALGFYIGVHAQTMPRNFFIAHDLDSVGYEWTAMAMNLNQALLVSTVSESNNNPAFGPLRLCIYKNLGRDQTVQASTQQSAGNFRALRMDNIELNGIGITGIYKGTSYLAGDTLIGFDSTNLNPFIALFDPNTETYAWAWHASLPGNNYFQRLRTGQGGEIIASGMANDSLGWLAAFDVTNGQMLWEKKFPGARTISDARFDPAFPGSLLITGTMPDTGYLFQAPVPLSGPTTGFRNFLARIYPQSDSAVFLKSVSGYAFDFAPVIVQDHGTIFNYYYLWSTPLANTNSSGQVQLRWDISNQFTKDSLIHENYYMELEEPFGHPVENIAFYKTPGINPNLFDLRSSTTSYTIGQFGFSTGTQPTFLADWTASEFKLAFRSTGSVNVDILAGAPWRDSTLFFANATPAQPKWVLLTTGFIISSVPALSPIRFTIYPNPVTEGRFRITTTAPLGIETPWVLRDLQGRAIQQGILSLDENEIFCGQLPKGMYLFELQSKAGSSIQKVLIH